MHKLFIFKDLIQNMEKIFSKNNPEILLCVVHKKKDFSEPRVDLSPENQYIQASCLVFHEGKEVLPHKHLELEKIGKKTQEVVIIIEGRLEVNYYDLDDSHMNKIILEEGDCIVTFNGGHSFKALIENTKIYEIKNGPYYGRKKDKLEI